MAPGPFDEVLMNTALLEDLAKFARDTACLNGCLMRPKPPLNAAYMVTYVPFMLFPTPMPRAAYFQAVEVQTHLNTLVDRVSQDPDFLEEALASTIEVDDFTARLFRIYKHILREGKSPSVVLGLNRCDYMLDQTSSLKQIEINTFAAGLGGLAAAIVKIHRNVLKVAGCLEESLSILDNNPAAGLARAMAKAWELYGSERAVVLLLTTQDDFNVFDQRCLEMELLKLNIFMMRRCFEDVSALGSLDQDDRLFVDGREVAVVYFRHGFVPHHYASEQTWDLRLMMERSRAVKCPDIATHLAGTKKVQQVLSRPGVLERFFPEQPRVVEQIRATFAGLYSLDMGPEGDRTVEMALAAPERFVLKPQREGGGNNIFGSDIAKVLQEATDKERSAYILMEKIQPTPSPNIMMKQDDPPTITNCVSELGVFGAYVRQGRDMVMNEQVGHLLRTKMAEYAEGGLSVGAAGIDNPLLF